MNVCVCVHVCVRAYVSCDVKTDEIRIVGTLSAFDWLDIADGDTKRQIIRADDFFFLLSSS